jgi:putative ABC transport system ATP-binding protein
MSDRQLGQTDGLARTSGTSSVGEIRRPLAAVQCRQLVKDYASRTDCVRALDGVDLEIAVGELTLLVGPSGCGKTTLISVLAGLLAPTAGEVEVLGTSLTDLSAAAIVEFRRRNIGFVFQQYNLLPTLTAAENAAVPLVMAGCGWRQAVVQSKAILEELGLGQQCNTLPSQMSGGQQQRVAIARALINRPRLLVCDEPTAALDARSGANVMRLLRQTALHPDRAVIVVTHDERVFPFGDCIIHMEDGRVTEVNSKYGWMEGECHAA